MRLANKLLLASTNRDKFEEFRSILEAYPEIELIPAQEIIRNPERLQFAENYETYLENAIAKARLANQASHYPSLADDSGLEVTHLGGKPGVKSHRYAPPKPKLTQDQANVQLLTEEMKSTTDRSARFICTLVLVIEGLLLHSTGVLEGTIVNDGPRGQNGFGYDSVFVPNGSYKTLAEMTLLEKNAVSHRTKALHDLISQLRTHGIVLAKP